MLGIYSCLEKSALDGFLEVRSQFSVMLLAALLSCLDRLTSLYHKRKLSISLLRLNKENWISLKRQLPSNEPSIVTIVTRNKHMTSALLDDSRQPTTPSKINLGFGKLLCRR